MAWDAKLGRCVDSADAGAPFVLRSFEAEPPASGYFAADHYLAAVRTLAATADVSRFNALIRDPDYRERFFGAYPDGRKEGMLAARDEILEQIDEVLQFVYLMLESVANDPSLATDFIAAGGAILLRPAADLSDAQSRALDERIAQLRNKLLPGLPQQISTQPLPFAGLRESTQALNQAVMSLTAWRDLLGATSKVELAFSVADVAFQGPQDWHDILVGAEDDAQTLFSATTEGLLRLNCDPAAQGHNLGWVVGYTGIWVATILIMETLRAVKSPL